jgi:putative ABC transport system permease protein
MRSIRNFLLALTYARRELRAGLKGFYIFLACLVLGTASIAGVQSLSEGLIDSLHYDGRFILGGDIALRTIYEPATPEQILFLQQKMRAVLSVVMETRAMARREDGSKAALVELKAVDPFYPLYGRMQFEDGKGHKLDKGPQDLILPPVDEKTQLQTDEWGAAVEPELLSRLGLKVGDFLVLGQQKFHINGVITREPDRVGAQHFSLAPRVMISSYTFEKTGLYGHGAQVYYDHRLLLPEVRTPADMEAAQKRIMDAFPKAQWKGRTCFNASPQIEHLVGQLTQFLTLIALTALLVGGVGISNAVRSFLDSKLANIATLKCLGATGAFVGRVYMLMILMLTAVGVALGLALGAGAALVAGEFLTAKLSLSDKVGLYPGPLAAAAAFGFLTSLCFSLWPIGKAARVTPNDLFRDMVRPAASWPPLNSILYILIAAQALALLILLTAEDRRLALWFIGGAGAVFLVFSLYAALIRTVLRRLHFPARPELRLALANLYRPGNASTGVILSLGLGLTVLVATALVQDNFSRLLTDDLSADTPSFFFLDIEPGQKDAFSHFIGSWPTAHGLLLAPSFRGRITAVNGKPPEEVLVDKNESWVINSDRGFTWARTLPAHSRIVAGTWWDADYKGPPLVSIATNVANAFHIGVGDTLTLGVYGADVTATVANVRDIAWSSFTMNFAITFAPGLIAEAPANYIATAAVDPKEEEALQMQAAQKFPNVTAVRVRDALGTAQVFVRAIAQTVRISAGVTLLGGILVLAGGIAASRRRHVYDAVILKVLGATQGRILKTFLLEYGTLGVLTALISAGFGTVAAYAAIVFALKLDWTFSLGVLLTVTGLSLCITILAGFAGTWRALRQKPALYLRNQ